MFEISVGQRQLNLNLARQSAEYIGNLELVGVQQVRWDKEPTDSLMYTHTNVPQI
jgi:hypothetical protein